MVAVMEIGPQQLLACCGVEYVHWALVADSSPLQAPPKKHAVRSSQKFATPWQAITDAMNKLNRSPGNGPGPRVRGRMLRARKATARHAPTWESLMAVTSEEFREWYNYGPLSHKELELIALENGYRIAAWQSARRNHGSSKHAQRPE